MDQKSFPYGAVCDAFEAQALSGLKGRYVLKRYKQDQTLQYSKVYVGKTEGDLVTLESYMEGEFVKYINNDGHICKKGSKIANKAEAFSHFICEI